MYSDLIKLESLLDHLHELERRIPASHERAILEVSRDALEEEIRLVAQGLRDRNYWRHPEYAEAG